MLVCCITCLPLQLLMPFWGSESNLFTTYDLFQLVFKLFLLNMVSTSVFLNFVALYYIILYYYPNCVRFLLLQATNFVLVPDKITKHLFKVAVALNNIVEVILKLGAGMFSILKQVFYISNR